MERQQGKYALIQFCPVPERQEYINVGVLLLVPGESFAGIKLARGQHRVARLFGKQPKAYFDAIKESFESRLNLEMANSPDGSGLAEFARKRANDLRLSQLLPVAVEEPKTALDRLFVELVGEDERPPREPLVRKKLRDAFVKNRVEQFLDGPSEIKLPEYGLSVYVPYGYQNGCYNLVDAMRVPSASHEALREAGKRAFEGGLIWKHFEQSSNCKRLVVVGDFPERSNGFYNAVREQFNEAKVGLYRFDDLNPLFRDIKVNADLHGKMHH